MDDRIQTECGVLLTGKNSSNLINHLSRLHKDAFTEYEGKEKDRLNFKLGLKRTVPDEFESPSFKSQSLESCVQRRIISWDKTSAQYKERLGRVTLDGWTKRGLSSSYLGISACFFNPASHRPCHAILNLFEVQLPHTGEMIAECLERCMQQWGLTQVKVQLIISNNGSNMVKAVRVLREKYQSSHEARNIVEDAGDEMEKSEAESDSDDDDEGVVYDSELSNESETVDLPEHLPYRRLPYLAHTLQLIVKQA